MKEEVEDEEKKMDTHFMWLFIHPLYLNTYFTKQNKVKEDVEDEEKKKKKIDTHSMWLFPQLLHLNIYFAK